MDRVQNFRKDVGGTASYTTDLERNVLPTSHQRNHLIKATTSFPKVISPSVLIGFEKLEGTDFSTTMNVQLPSLLPWCRQCDRNGHIDYTKIPCSRCNGSHQTSQCPITVMGMCVYCSAVGIHFSQLCPQRNYVPFCNSCGRTNHTSENCIVPLLAP